MLSDQETMSYNHAWGGTVAFPEARWAEWYDCWLCGDGKHYYRYVVDERGTFVGEIAYHYDEDYEDYVADVIIYARYRGHGYGGQALDALCAAAKANGVERLLDDIAIDNPALGMFERRGWTEAYRTNEKIVLVKTL